MRLSRILSAAVFGGALFVGAASAQRGQMLQQQRAAGVDAGAAAEPAQHGAEERARSSRGAGKPEGAGRGGSPYLK